MAFKYFPEVESERLPLETVNEYVDIEDIVRTEGLQKPPIPPKPVFPIDVELVDDDLLDIEIETSELDKNAKIAIVEITESKENDFLPVSFWVVEDKPEIVGGLSILQKKVIYPELAVKAGIQGKVILETIIGQDRKPESISILKGIEQAVMKMQLMQFVKLNLKQACREGSQSELKWLYQFHLS